MLKHGLALVAFVLTAATLSAAIGPPTDIPTRARESARIVVGRVTDVRSQFETNRFGDQLIVSTAEVEVLETLKGPPQASLEVAVEGGTVGGLTLRVSDMPSLKAGDRALFFLDASATGVHAPHDRGRGILRIDPSDRVEGTSTTLDEVRRQIVAAAGRGGR